MTSEPKYCDQCERNARRTSEHEQTKAVVWTRERCRICERARGECVYGCCRKKVMGIADIYPSNTFRCFSSSYDRAHIICWQTCAQHRVLDAIKRKTNSNEFDAQDESIAGNGTDKILLKRSTNGNNNNTLNFWCENIYTRRRIHTICVHDTTPGWNAGSASETKKSNFVCKQSGISERKLLASVCVAIVKTFPAYGNFMWISSCFNVSATVRSRPCVLCCGDSAPDICLDSRI